MIDIVSQITIKSGEIGLPVIEASGSQLDRIFGLVYVALAAFGILFIIIAALRMITQGDDANAQKLSRQTIIYVVVALAASTIVLIAIQWIIKRVGG